MKFMRFLVVVGFLAICASAARADGVDPGVKITGVCQTNCDAVVIGPGQDSVNISETISCSSATDPTSCIADEYVINFSGTNLSTFDLTLNSSSLSFSCLATTSTADYSCSPLGGGVFAFTAPTGSTFCSTDGNDISPTYSPSNPGPYTFNPDGDADDNCSVIDVQLQGTSAETVQELNGQTVTGTLAAPEPSSALLLLFGFMAGLAVLKFSRSTVA